MDPAVRELVRTRGSNACEYCRIPQEATPVIPFHVEHIVSRQHGGTDDPATLALACDRCNAYKGPNLTSIDPDSGVMVALFNPRHAGTSKQQPSSKNPRPVKPKQRPPSHLLRMVRITCACLDRCYVNPSRRRCPACRNPPVQRPESAARPKLS